MISITKGSHHMLKPSHAITKSTLFAVCKDKWSTKEDTGKSIKNTLQPVFYVNLKACLSLVLPTNTAPSWFLDYVICGPPTPLWSIYFEPLYCCS